MAKKSKKKESEHMEPVTNCDQSKELVANNDQLNDVVEITSAEDIDITKLIVVVRDQQVLIDRDIAMLYKVETKVLNQKVKRNVARFPERFRFQLTKQEMKELVTNCDRFESLKHSSSAPYAFTEQGISMLSAVVTSQKAVIWQQMPIFSSVLIEWKGNKLRVSYGWSRLTIKSIQFFQRWTSNRLSCYQSRFLQQDAFGMHGLTYQTW